MLDIAKLLDQGVIKPGYGTSGLYAWTDSIAGKRTASVSYEAKADCTTGHLRLSYTSKVWSTAETRASDYAVSLTTTLQPFGGRRCYTSKVWSTAETRASDYAVSLTTTLQPFGGRRWWFLCPRTGRRVAKLYLPNGAFVFASRQAYRLGYRSQHETPRDRALNRAFKLRRKLGAEGGIGEVVPKPKGMHQTTFDRKIAKVWRAEAVCDAHLMSFVDRFHSRRKA